MLHTIFISLRAWDYVSEGAVKSLDSITLVYVAVANACQTNQSELCQLNDSIIGSHNVI